MTRRLSMLLILLLMIPLIAEAKIFDLKEGTLSNGLKVVTIKDSTVPVLTFAIFVDASVRKEREGITGISHFSEHFFSLGSKKVKPREMSEIISRWGGMENAYTGFDYTSYWASVPKRRLDKLTELYADMLMNKTFPESYFKSEMMVVMEERRLTDNSPYASAFLNFQDLAFFGTKYKYPILGYPDDLKKMTVNDVKEYYGNFYSPENIVAVVCGDVEHKDVMQSFKKWFSPFKNTSAKKEPFKVIEKRKIERRIIHEREGQKIPILMIGYETTDFDNDDTIALQAISDIFSDGMSSRLSRNLVRGKQVASSISSHLLDTKEKGVFIFQAEPMENVSPLEVERDIYAEIEKLSFEGPTLEELNKVIASMEKGFITGLQTTRSKADLVGSSYMMSKKKYMYYEDYLSKLKKITPKRIKDVAKKYFTDNRKVVYLQVDKGLKDKFKNIDQPAVKNYSNAKEIDFPNGIRLFVDSSNEIPAVKLNILVKGGSFADAKGKEGTSNLLAMILKSGAKNMNEEELASFLDENAIDLSIGSSDEYISFSMSFLKDNTLKAIDTVASILKSPRFDKAIFEREKKRILSRIESQKANPKSVGSNALKRVLLGKRYGHPASGYINTVKKLSLSDLRKYYESNFSPQRFIISVSGDVDTDNIEKTISLNLGGMKKDTKSDIPPKFDLDLKKNRYFVVDMPWVTQAYIYAGAAGLERNNIYYNRARVMNYILGASGLSSRLASKLRTEMGLAYSVYSYFDYYRDFGTFNFGIQTKVDSIRVALEGFYKELTSFSMNGPYKKEFDDAKSYYDGILPFRSETIEQRASNLSEGAFYGPGPEMIFKDLEQIRKLSMDDIKKDAKRFEGANFYFVIVGDKKRIKEILKGYPLEYIKIADIF